MKIAQVPSPNFNHRADGSRIKFVILHYTGMPTAEEALKRMTDPSSEVSSHYMIDEDGSVTQLVAEDMRAWHSGKSFWQGERDINSHSIGIEIVNPGHAFGYRPFPDVQINALQDLLDDIMQRHSIQDAGVLGHSDVAPVRKQDPGELFPWEALAKDGIGVWPNLENMDKSPAVDGEAMTLLQAIGYDLADESELDFVVTAFQRHFRPSNVDGFIDPETIGVMRAVAALYERLK